MPTIRDVAREAGVSIATVSYVFNNKLESVSEGTRQHVLAAAQRIGYMPNVTARNLRSNQTRLIGYAWYETAWHGVARANLNTVLDWFTYYLARNAEEAGYHLLTFTCPLHDPVSTYEELVRTHRVDGFVLAGTTMNDLRVQYLMEHNVPFVSFGRSNPEWDFPWIDTDGATGVRRAVDYLIELGHRKIAMISWPEESLTGNYRLQGYLNAMAAAGLSIGPDSIFRGDHSEQTGRAAVQFWASLPADERPTAVMCISDLIAIGVMNEAEHWGFEVGKTLSVIGFDDLPMTEYLRPALTTLQQPIHLIGESLLRMLETVLNKGELNPTHQLIAPELIIRDSCSPPA